MKISRRKSKRAKAAGFLKTYLEFKAARRLARFSPVLGAVALGAALLKRRRGSGEPAAV